MQIERIRKARIEMLERLRTVRPQRAGLLNTAIRLVEAQDIKGAIKLLRRMTAVNRALLKHWKKGEEGVPTEGIVAEYFAEFFTSQEVSPAPEILTELERVLKSATGSGPARGV